MHPSPSQTPPSITAHSLEIHGPDAIGFIQSQFSSNLLALQDGQWQHSAWLDPQGRVRYLLQLARLDPQRLIILLRGGDAAQLARELQRFVFRSKLQIALRSPAPIRTGPPLPVGQLQLSEAELAWGCGDHRMCLAPQGTPDLDWLQRQTEAGWAWLPAAAADRHVAAALGLPQLGGTALDKGCYPGQEIVARLHYRGGLKRHLALLEALQAAAPGDALMAGETAVGQWLHPLPIQPGEHALAVLADDANCDNARLIRRWEG